MFTDGDQHILNPEEDQLVNKRPVSISEIPGFTSIALVGFAPFFAENEFKI